jgi:hypothetical protein
MSYIFVPEYAPDDPKSKTPRSPKGGQGRYRVTIVLSIPGKHVYYDDVNLNDFVDSGESLIEIPDIISLLTITSIDVAAPGEAFLSTNQQHRLSKAVLYFDAADFLDAERKAHEMVHPFLSWWSFKYDVAIDMKGYEAREENTGVVKYSLGFEGKVKTFGPDQIDEHFSFPSEWKYLFSAYREGLNATNTFYQFLCFYKVVEGISNLRSGRTTTMLGERIPSKNEDLPSKDPSIVEIFQPYMGQKFNRVKDRFSNQLRNAMAHIDPMQKVLLADRYDDIVECEKANHVIKYIAREMMRNEFNLKFGRMP